MRVFSFFFIFFLNLITYHKKAHTIRTTLILPGVVKIARLIHGKQYRYKIKCMVLLSAISF